MARLPDNWDKTEPINTALPEEQLRDAIIESDCEAVKVGAVVLDGKVHRFKVSGDTASEKSGWYIGYSDHVPAGSFGNWRKGLTLDWCAESGKEFTPSERAAYAETIARARQVRDEEEAKYHAEIAKVAQKIWDTAQECTGHPYLEKKQIKNHGLKVTGEAENPRLIVPIYVGDKIASLQYIDADGNKQYHGGGEVKCGYCPIIDSSNSNELAGPIYIAEGYATAASIHEATDCVSIMALNAGNLTNVAKYIRQIYGEQQQIVIVGDNDQNGTGQKAANEAGAAIGARVIIPPYVSNDANDVAVIYGVAALKAMLTDYTPWLLQADEFSQNPAPINWLVKHWLQKKGLAMMFGASGTGKTFVALDWVLRIASNIDDWAGNKIHHGAVVYLAGEGHQGLRARIAGWKQYHHVDHLNAWISSSGCDLNTDAGLRQVVKEIQDLNITDSNTDSQGIAVIVVDTLHRFLSGDENSAQDAKTMLDSCGELSRLFGCTVILIHHTGVNEEAQNRARGSSSWRGALDNQIQVSSDGGDIVLKMVKNKDGELADDIYLERIPVNIGWHDEDGEPVSTIVLETDDNAVSNKSKNLSITKNQQLGIQCLRKAADETAIIRDGIFIGVADDEWRRVFYEDCQLSNQSSKRSAFKRITEDLLNLNQVVVINSEKKKIYRPIWERSELEINQWVKKFRHENE